MAQGTKLMNVMYKKDIQGHSLVIPSERKENNYCLNMLLNNRIKGILPIELRIIDNIQYYYYEITAHEELSCLLEKKQLQYSQIKTILLNIIKAILAGKEYLLYEEDFILDPKYIYLNLETYDVLLCYYIGYEEEIMGQISSVIEFLMNKVDYKDEKAVLLIYGLYKISKEESVTFLKLSEYLEKRNVEFSDINNNNNKLVKNIINTSIGGEERIPIQDKDSMKKTIRISGREPQAGKEDKYVGEKDKYVGKKDKYVGKKDKYVRKEDKYVRKEDKNVRKEKKDVIKNNKREKVYSEEEILEYPIKTKTMLFLVSFLGFGILVACFRFGMLSNPIGNKIDGSKVFGLVLMIGTAEAYVYAKLLNKENRIAKIKEKIEYVSKNIECYEEGNEDKTQLLREAMGDKTVLLTEGMECYPLKGYELEPAETLGYKKIKLKDFPFFIGNTGTKKEGMIESNVISRYHAKIEYEEGEFYIIDLNSTNGTYINSHRLEPNETKILHLQDEVMFANIRYIFQKEM